MPVKRDEDRTPHLITWDLHAVGEKGELVGVHARYGESENIVPRDNVENKGYVYWHAPDDWHGPIHFEIHGSKGVETGTVTIP